MTIEEMIKIAKGLRTDFKCESDTMVDFCNTIIKALEQQSCEDWYDVPSNEMTLEQARQAVKDLRKKLAEYLEQQPCEDCISRQAVIEITAETGALETQSRVRELPTVTPKEKSEYEHDHEVVKAYNDGQAYILDKIRAEIENDFQFKQFPRSPWSCGLRRALEIIDKYRESEDKE